MQTTSDHRLNGHIRPSPTERPTPKRKGVTTAPNRSPRHKPAKRLTTHQRTALVVGSVAAGLVFLSVYHLTCAVSTLTGSPLVLAVLLAVGIDLGLVASEVAEMVAGEDRAVRGWSKVYMLMATVMSMVLNAYEFAAHAPQNWFSQTLSVGFGLVLPVMIFVLARQAGGLWSKK